MPTGVLSSTAINRMNAAGGISLALRPTDLALSQGQEIARMIVLHADSLQTAAQYADDNAADE